MRKLTLDEIIEYAEKIELENYKFYSKAKEIRHRYKKRLLNLKSLFLSKLFIRKSCNLAQI